MTITIFVLFYSAPLADLYSLSYLWISGLSFGAAIVVGVIASFALGNYLLLNYSILIVSNKPIFLGGGMLWSWLDSWNDAKDQKGKCCVGCMHYTPVIWSCPELNSVAIINVQRSSYSRYENGTSLQLTSEIQTDDYFMMPNACFSLDFKWFYNPVPRIYNFI